MEMMMELLLLTDELCSQCDGEGRIYAGGWVHCAPCAGTGRQLLRFDPALLNSTAAVASLARRVDELERKASR